jgi:hypothetical protein
MPHQLPEPAGPPPPHARHPARRGTPSGFPGPLRTSPAPTSSPATEARARVPAPALVPGFPDLVGLQQRAGNRAVATLLRRRQPGAVQREPQPGRPADLDVGFNPQDIAHRLVEAINQNEIKSPVNPQRHVNLPAVVSALSGRTVTQIQEIDRAYTRFEGRPLRVDLLGGGQSGFPTDLRPDEVTRVRALLEGTRAAAGEGELAFDLVELNRLDADAAELHSLLHGDLPDASVERVMTLLRRDAKANAAVGTRYHALWGVDLAGDLTLLGVANLPRAILLLGGSTVAADSLKVGVLRAQVAEIDAEIRELRSSSGMEIVITAKIDLLRKRRRGIVADIEARVGQAGAEARQAALEQADLTEPGVADAAAGQAAKDRMRAVLGGDVEKAAASLGGADAEALRALAGDNPAARAAAHLHQLREADALNAAAITETLRGLREQAEQQARQAMPLDDPAAQAGAARSLAEDYLHRLATAYDAGRPAGGPSFDQLVAGTGSLTDVLLNQTLRASGGEIDPVADLRFALAGDRKDLETVKRVLRGKSAAEIEEIKRRFPELESELFGRAPTTAGEDNDVADFFAKMTGTGGKATGADRLTLEDYLQRPKVEGGLEEANYIVGRAEREYQYAIDNRGFTGWWRDHWGNEARSLMDESIRNIRQLFIQFVTSGGTDAEALRQMRLWRATIRGDRAGYEKANAELRATFEAVAAFALQVALTALLTPAAAAIFRVAEGAEAALFAARAVKVARGLIVNTVSTVTANAAVQDNYGLASLEHDLLGGLGSLVGSTSVSKLSGLLGNRIVSSLAGKEVVSAASTLAGIEATAMLEGRSLTADLSVRNFLLTHGQGKIAHAVIEAVTLDGRPTRAGATEPTPTEESTTTKPAKGEEVTTTEPAKGEPSTDAERALAAPAEGTTPTAKPTPTEETSGRPLAGEEPTPTEEPTRRPAEATTTPAEASTGDGGPSPVTMTAQEFTWWVAETLKRPVRPMQGRAFFHEDMRSYWKEYSRRFPGELPPDGGFFDPNTGELHVAPRPSGRTVLHEAIHKVAEETSPLAKQGLGEYLNEGITEEITRSRLGSPAGAQGYDRNVAFVQALQDRLGVAVVHNAILHGDLGAFRRAVRARLGGSEAATLEFMKLVSSVGATDHDSPNLRAAIDLLDGRATPRARPEEGSGSRPEEGPGQRPEDSSETRSEEASRRRPEASPASTGRTLDPGVVQEADLRTDAVERALEARPDLRDSFSWAKTLRLEFGEQRKVYDLGGMERLQAAERLMEIERRAAGALATIAKAPPRGTTGFDHVAFKEYIGHLSVNDRIGAIKGTAKVVAESKGWELDTRLSDLNKIKGGGGLRRTVYRDPSTGHLYAVDTESGTFEHCDATGKHQEEINFGMERTDGPDKTGGHDLRV